jgi:hypothetical protein
MIYQTVKYNMRMVMWSVSCSSYERKHESRNKHGRLRVLIVKKFLGFWQGLFVGWGV